MLPRADSVHPGRGLDGQEGRTAGGRPAAVGADAPSQADRSLGAFFQAIIFRMTGDFDQPIKLL